MIEKKKFYPDYPIVLGLAGKAATGKTSVAESIVPKAQINKPVYNNISWDHIFFALPLYELASIKKNTLGQRQKDRQLFSIHEVVYDIFGASALGSIPTYDDFYQLVKDIHNLPIEPEGIKPRSFLQKAGDLCRAHDSECFAKWGIIKTSKMFREYMSTQEYIEQETPLCVIVSDVRFENEAAMIAKQPNGIIVCYEASDEVRSQRMMKRDGQVMTVEQTMHKSELEMHLVKEYASAIIDTDGLSIEQQSQETIKLVQSFTDVYA